ncbi:threonine synthase [Lutimonas saemankumensis]|uniref:threonine synthase n=1 Tax=Lutimonas saemankumensis TaxID=483016 RepID=UPI001CD54236|nr:threonine synthase [Lutimonas saemankumensis]MCA0931615.1 threonine synthase [Lutimonas saemankumensis]
MQYFSLHGKAPKVGFKEAVIKGIAPDKGLYFPETIPAKLIEVFENIDQYEPNELAFEMINPFIDGEIPEAELKNIIEDTLCFNFPLEKVEEDVYSLELFHGPTMAFKDVGGRFMARCLSYFNREQSNEVTVLVATSGDTGGAVASGFLGVKGVNVVILYPSGKVSEVQEKQLTTLGQNIKALEVDGTFDDCQAMVKEAFLDAEITDKIQLTSANSINVARWLPQMFYFAFAYKQLKDRSKPLVFSTPSGNFGNICAGIMAQQLGLPVQQFVASTNANKVVPNFMEKGEYIPLRSVATISNAMDVGDPSNFIRIREIYKNDFALIKENLSSYSFTDDQTRAAMLKVYEETGYIMDPHGAVGYLGLKKYLKSNPDSTGIFLETAHPVKFLDVVEPVINKKIAFPEQIKSVMDKPKVAQFMTDYSELKNFLLTSD